MGLLVDLGKGQERHPERRAPMRNERVSQPRMGRRYVAQGASPGKRRAASEKAPKGRQKPLADRASVLFCRPAGACDVPATSTPGLTPWATYRRRSAAHSDKRSLPCRHISSCLPKEMGRPENMFPRAHPLCPPVARIIHGPPGGHGYVLIPVHPRNPSRVRVLTHATQRSLALALNNPG
jgi:hypothetical protein